MLATMRPVQHHQTNSQGHSRSASRNSNYSSNNPSPSASPSRATSAKLPRVTSSTSTSKQNEKDPESVATTARLPKKSVPSALSKEIVAVEQTKPGLITLSKPLDSAEKKGKGRNQGTSEGSRGRPQGQFVQDESTQVKAPKPPRKKKGTVPAGLEEIKANDSLSSLSKSAPTSNKGGKDEWMMPSVQSRGEEKGEAPLTWQQQMINSAAPTANEKKKAIVTAAKKTVNKKNTTVAAANATSKESLTWQQELLGSNKPRGPAFDVFADAKDEATFGGMGGGDVRVNGVNANQSKSKRQGGGGANNRKRADSVGEIRLPHTKGTLPIGPPSAPLSSSNSGPSMIGFESPSTPNSKFAYAGPNFHNSPSPASLPVPKFLQGKGMGDMPKSPSSLFAREAMKRHAADGSGSGISNDEDGSESGDDDDDDDDHSWEEEQKRRSIRGVTAPPELQTAGSSDDSGNRSVTIESLLAKMMRTGSD